MIMPIHSKNVLALDMEAQETTSQQTTIDLLAIKDTKVLKTILINQSVTNNNKR